MSIVITGATGQLGRLVIEELIGRGIAGTDIVAAGRSVPVLQALAERGIRTAGVDYDNPSTIAGALGEGDILLLISGNDIGRRRGQHKAAIDAAVQAGVGRILYTSALAADDTPLIVAPDHLYTEQLIRESGIPFTILRNGWYTENYVQALEQAKATGAVVASVGEGRVASAARADFAAAIAGVLTSEGHDGATYELSGDHAWDYSELAEALSDVLGRTVAYTPLTTEEHLVALEQAGIDPQTAGFITALDANIRDGALALTTGDLARLAGRPATPLVDALRPWA